MVSPLTYLLTYLHLDIATDTSTTDHKARLRNGQATGSCKGPPQSRTSTFLMKNAQKTCTFLRCMIILIACTWKYSFMDDYSYVLSPSQHSKLWLDLRVLNPAPSIQLSLAALPPPSSSCRSLFFFSRFFSGVLQ